MKAKLESKELPTAEYFRLVKTEHNMFQVETIQVSGSRVVNVEATESTFLPIAFDKLRRKTGEAFFTAVQG